VNGARHICRAEEHLRPVVVDEWRVPPALILQRRLAVGATGRERSQSYSRRENHESLVLPIAGHPRHGPPPASIHTQTRSMARASETAHRTVHVAASHFTYLGEDVHLGVKLGVCLHGARGAHDHPTPHILALHAADKRAQVVARLAPLQRLQDVIIASSLHHQSPASTSLVPCLASPRSSGW
jgi:hypothetical protein